MAPSTGTSDAPTRVSLWRTYAFAFTTTLLVWVITAWVGALQDGWHGLVLLTLQIVALTVLEVTFSFDNAIVNSRLLKHLNPWWQRLFMTVGILIAVFVVRFALPIFIVMLTTHLGFVEVGLLAFNDPTTYAHELEKAGPMIDAFGGTFLLMIGLAYFIDSEKETHWIGWLERRLAPLGRFDNIGIFSMILGAIAMYFTVPEDATIRATVMVAAICGIALHVGLGLFGAVTESSSEDDEDEDAAPGNTKPNSVKTLVGVAAALMFVRLEVLDASFSFDGVIGAFAITSSVLIIVGGLGAGAVWVRALTVHLLRTGTLAKFRYLEHGAMWAILFLGGIMIAKLYHTHLPEWATGSVGLVFILAAVLSSKRAQRRDEVIASTPLG